MRKPQADTLRTVGPDKKANLRRMNAEARLAADVHVFEPHRTGLPPVGPYLGQLWNRREFALELARANLRAQHYNTTFGQVWLILNPLLLAGVYFTLVTIVRGGSRGSDFFAHLMLCLFAFRLVSTSVGEGARSVISGGRLILNVAFPRTLLPLASVMTAFMRFLPTMAVYAVLHVALGLPIDLELLWAIPLIGLTLVFATGAAMIAATAQVYFRDLTNFLPYVTRVWLYTSPVLYYADEIPARLQPILQANPLYPLLAGLSETVNQGQSLNPEYLAAGAAWAFGTLLVGALFFVSREREFAVRL
jgi:teichoic acid transport system permease protein